MRVAPIGIFNYSNVDSAIEDAIQSALPSHGSKPGIASAAAIAAAVSKAIAGRELAVKQDYGHSYIRRNSRRGKGDMTFPLPQ